MPTLRRLSRISIKLLVYLTLVCLLLATLWTLTQVQRRWSDERQFSATRNARQGAYRATGTALAAQQPEVGAGDEAQIVLMQQIFVTSTPSPEISPANSAASAPIGTPEPVDLPKLILPADPEAGLELAGTAVPTRVPVVPREYDLINIIFLGGDDELTADQSGRTDTMIILSLNIETGTASMINLPRDLFVYIPSGKMGRLNTAFGIGRNIGWEPGGGFGLLRQTIFYNFGINVHYYARVNFSGFKTIIDRLGGVDIAVDCTYRDLYPVTRTASGAAEGSDYDWRTLDVGYYTFDGYDALWYARTRRYTDDLDRGRRQQLLLRGMWRKARENGLLNTVPAIWQELEAVLDTNLPFNVMLSLLPFALELDLDSMQNFTFLRRYHSQHWQTPSGDAVLLPVYETVVQLMRAFYTPPSANQVGLAGPSIVVYNGSGKDNWDLVASERLRWDGYNSVARGPLANGQALETSKLIDYVATSKGSLTPGITNALNMTRKQVETQADPAREYDYEVIVGQDYDSCTYGVLPVEE